MDLHKFHHSLGGSVVSLLSFSRSQIRLDIRNSYLTVLTGESLLLVSSLPTEGEQDFSEKTGEGLGAHVDTELCFLIDSF